MSLSAPAHYLARPWLIIDVQHGLANRLRALVSAAVIAARTNRHLVVLWQTDAHCEGRLADLLNYPGTVIENACGGAIADQADLTISYMEVDPEHSFGQPLLSDPETAGKSVYIRSAYSLISPHTDFQAEQRILKSLQPCEAVQALVASVRHPNQVAAHVRMASGSAFEHLPYEAPGNWTVERHAEITAWRAKSQASQFVKRVETLIADGKCDSLFLAADLAETYAHFSDRFGARVVWLPRQAFDRSARQLQYALADMLLLTAADRFLASTWSSFSDLAQRLARPGRIVEQSGRDF